MKNKRFVYSDLSLPTGFEPGDVVTFQVKLKTPAAARNMNKYYSFIYETITKLLNHGEKPICKNS